MVRISEMREQRNSHVTEMRALLENNSGKWGAELQTKYDQHDSAVADLDKQINNAQRLADLEAESKFGMSEAGIALPGAKPANRSRDIYAKWLRKGDNGLTADDWATVRNVTSTTTPAEGGFTVQTDVATSLLDGLKDYSGMRQAAQIIRTASGNPLSYPTSDGTAEEGEIVAENGSATDLDPTFGVLSLGVFKFSSKVITVPIELVQDSQIDIEAFVQERLVTRLGRITEKMYTTGSGTGQPRGLVTAATTGVTGATGSATTVSYDQLVDLEHSVDPAYRNNAAFMFNDSTLRAIRKLKDSQNRPIFVPGYEQGNPGGAPATLLGRRIIINQQMASMAANAKSIAFGDFSYYKIRDVMDVTMFRFTDSAYTKKGQIGFLAWMRSGGNLIDIGGAVKLYVNSAT